MSTKRKSELIETSGRTEVSGATARTIGVEDAQTQAFGWYSPAPPEPGERITPHKRFRRPALGLIWPALWVARYTPETRHN